MEVFNKTLFTEQILAGSSTQVMNVLKTIERLEEKILTSSRQFLPTFLSPSPGLLPYKNDYDWWLIDTA